MKRGKIPGLACRPTILPWACTWARQLKRDPIHKKIMEIRDVFVNDDNFDHRKALEAVIDNRKFLLKRLFRNTWSPIDIDS
jgi:hypothetical protein